MPKKGDIKVNSSSGYRLEVWVGHAWKGVALDSRSVRNTHDELRVIPFREKQLYATLLQDTCEFVDGGETDDRTRLSKTSLVSICNVPFPGYSYVNLLEGVRGQMKIIVFKEKHALGPNSLIVYSKHFQDFEELTCPYINRVLFLVHDGEYWYPLGGLDDDKIWTTT